MDLILTEEKQARINELIDRELIKNGVEHVFLVDMAGTLIVEKGNYPLEDVLPLAALSAANFGATAEIARLVGEEDFTLLFHKGEKYNLHFSKIGDQFILVILFGKNVSLGLIRYKINRISDEMLSILLG
ncbi:MAG: roadblock/LC7 domain-containing protein [Thermodesulforhabdaceae bacterium]|jgi:predicted regulator of Ras-like GTPase activity (Roadblock/LC7/MglB family)